MASTDATVTFAMDLEGDLESGSVDATRALEALYKSIDRDEKALKGMNMAMKRLQAGNVMNVNQFRALKDQIDQTTKRIAQSQSAILGLGGSAKAPRRSTQQLRDSLAELTKQAQGLGGPLGGVGSKMTALRSMLAGGAMALGALAIAAAFVALTAAAIASVAALTKYGVAQADARRSELLRLEGMTKMRSMLGLVPGNAKEIQNAIDGVAASTAAGREEVAGFANQLYKAGLRGDNLSQALEAVAIKATTQGDEAARAFAGLASGIALSGGSVKALANNVKARLGGVAAAQMLSLTVQSKKLRESWDALFNGLKIEPFLQALKSITNLFAANTVTGRALRGIMTTMIQPLINAFTFLEPIIRGFFQGMVIGMLLLQNGMLRLALWFKRTFGTSGLLKHLDLGEAAMYAGVAVVGLLATAFATLGAVIALAVAPVAAVLGAFGGIGYAAAAAFDYVTSIDWGKLGSSIVDGVIGGIGRKAAALYQSVKDLGNNAMKALRDALDIHSPSREFAKIGAQIPAGVEQGVDKGTPSVETAVSDMVDVPSSAPRGKGGPSAGGATIVFEEGAIVIQTDAKTAPGIAQDIAAALERLLSGVSIQMGAAK